jgi:putative lipoprotein
MRIPLLLSVLFLTGCSHMANDSWSGQDKAQHFRFRDVVRSR